MNSFCAIAIASIALMTDTTCATDISDLIDATVTGQLLIDDVDAWNGGIRGVAGSTGMGVYIGKRETDSIGPGWNGAFPVDVDRQFVPTGTSSLTSISQARAIYMNVEAYRAATALGQSGERFKAAAETGANFMQAQFIDPTNRGGPVARHGGYWWKINNDTTFTPSNRSKDAYGQVQPIFALAHLYQITGNTEYINAALDGWNTYNYHFGDSQSGLYPGAYLPRQVGDYASIATGRTRIEDYMVHAFETAAALWDALPDCVQRVAIGQQIEAIGKHIVTKMIVDQVGSGGKRAYAVAGYESDWTPLRAGTHISIGHQLEIAYLLSRAVESGFGDATWIDTGRKLMNFAFEYGVESLGFGPETLMGITHNRVNLDGTPFSGETRDLRWWEQAEFARATAHYAQVRGDDYWDKFAAIKRLIDDKLTDSKYPGWLEVLNADSLDPIKTKRKGWAWKVHYHNAMLQSELLRLYSLTVPSADPAVGEGDSKVKNNTSIGMGLNGISDWSTQLPFIDLMKQSREWVDWDSGIDGFDLDGNDWVRSLKPGQIAATVFLTLDDDAMPFDKVIVLYEGEGTLRYSWASRLITEESTPGRDIVSVAAGANLLSIMETRPDNPIRNIRIIPEPYLQAHETGQIFNPDWLHYVGQFRAFRFMDWMKTNGSTQGSWSNRPKTEDRTWRINGGVPLEIMIKLANEQKADPWFNLPHLADNHYVEQFALTVKQELAPQRIVYIEHSNEVWKREFEQFQYAKDRGRARWGDHDDAFMQWHGMRTAQICDAFKLGAFVNNTERVKCVLGVHTRSHGLQPGAVECPLWTAEENTPCYQHGIDYIGLTSYFRGGLNGPGLGQPHPDLESELRSWFGEEDGGLSKAFEQLSQGIHLSHINGFEEYRGVADELRKQLDYWNNYAEQFNLGIVAYEGGQHITANGLALESDEDVVNFHIAINRDGRMQQVYTDLLNAWKEGGGGLSMHFIDFDAPDEHGSWGALENLNQETSPKWQALVDFNTDVKCWWQGCSDRPWIQLPSATANEDLNRPSHIVGHQHKGMHAAMTPVAGFCLGKCIQPLHCNEL